MKTVTRKRLSMYDKHTKMYERMSKEQTLAIISTNRKPLPDTVVQFITKKRTPVCGKPIFHANVPGEVWDKTN